MRYVRDLSAEDFWGHVQNGATVGMVLFVVYAVICAMVIFPITGVQNKDRGQERALYFALAGKEVVDQRAKDTATYIKLMYSEGIHNLDIFYGPSIDFGAYAPNSLKFASDHKDRIEEIIKNPAKADDYAAYAPHISWWGRGYFYLFLLGTVGYFVLTMSVSIGYVWYTIENTPRRAQQQWWRYPWRMRFAYFWLPLMIPYLVCTQIWVLGMFIVRQILGADRRAEIVRETAGSEIAVERPKPESAADKEKAARQAFESLVEQARNDLPESRKNWVNITREGLKFAREDARAKIQEVRGKLTQSAAAIEELQRILAVAKALANKLEEAIGDGDKKNTADREREFEALLHKEGIRALRVTPNSVEVFTETIFIDLGGERFEIGDFHVVADTKNKVIVRNLRNTGKGVTGHPFGGDGSFCFGSNAEKVQNALTRRDFLPLVTFILEALRSSNGLNRETLMMWKLVEGRA